MATGSNDGPSVPVALRTLLLVPRRGAADAVAPNVPFAFSVVFPVVLCVPPREGAADETTRISPAVLPKVLPMTTPPASDAAPGLPILALVASPEGVEEAPSLPDAMHATLTVARPGAVDVVVRKLAALVPVESSVALPLTSPPATDATPGVPVLPPVVWPVGVDEAPVLADAWPVVPPVATAVVSPIVMPAGSDAARIVPVVLPVSSRAHGSNCRSGIDSALGASEPPEREEPEESPEEFPLMVVSEEGGVGLGCVTPRGACVATLIVFAAEGADVDGPAEAAPPCRRFPSVAAVTAPDGATERRREAHSLHRGGTPFFPDRNSGAATAPQSEQRHAMPKCCGARRKAK